MNEQASPTEQERIAALEAENAKLVEANARLVKENARIVKSNADEIAKLQKRIKELESKNPPPSFKGRKREFGREQEREF
jgi:hypothetical protein